MTHALITDKAQLLKAIDAWGSKGKKWIEEGQHLGMSALAMSGKHGDIGPVNRLVLAMPKGSKVTAMMSWLLAHGPFEQNADKLTAKEKPLVYTKNKVCDLTGASEDLWFSHKEESHTDPVFDIQKALEAVLKRAQGKQLAHPELLTGVQGLLAMTSELHRTQLLPEVEEDID